MNYSSEPSIVVYERALVKDWRKTLLEMDDDNSAFE
jgi:hypothetical protein